MKKINFLYFFGLLSLLIASFSFSKIRSKQRKISEIETYFKGQGARFLTPEMVNKLLIQSEDSLFFQQKVMVALRNIEFGLLNNPVIKTAEIYAVPEGKLYVEIEERRPLVRVQGEHSFYVDEFGVELPLSSIYSARVPLFYGEITTENKYKLVQLLSHLNADLFFKEELVDIQLEGESFVLSLRNYPFKVIWGNVSQNVEKRTKLKRFCAYANLNKQNKFNRIDLRFSKQVVARHN